MASGRCSWGHRTPGVPQPPAIIIIISGTVAFTFESYHYEVCGEPVLLLAPVVAPPPSALLLVHVGDDDALAERMLVALVGLVVVQGLVKENGVLCLMVQ